MEDFQEDESFSLTEKYESTYRPYAKNGSPSTSQPSPGRCSGLAKRRKPVSKPLACINCRRKKVKCHLGPGGKAPCGLCDRVGSKCELPIVDERRLSNSRKLIAQLYGRISVLESELEIHRTQCGWAERSADNDDEGQPLDLDLRSITPESGASSSSDNMITRLCGGQTQLNSDRAGRLRFFGPTSSLHLSESFTSSVLIREPSSIPTRCQWQDVVPVALQKHLFDLYWTYQHQVLPIIHKESFLQDFENGHNRYCSKLLVHCILARAASISDQADIRALALTDDDINEDPPVLVRQCASLLDVELNSPGITTLQSLQLLSDIYCVICNDTKGWLDAGGACRLAFELGLHSDSKSLISTQISQCDLEVRQIAFWSCFSLDRQWALYLGRPQMIKVEDVTAPKPEIQDDASLELKMSIMWANLLEIVGAICDAINGVKSTKHRVVSLDKRLSEWQETLDPGFQYSWQQAPAVILLHMQHSAAVILLHRPLAGFGNSSENRSPASDVSREICVRHACLIAHRVQDYQRAYGSALTMSWFALHMIATASTTLVANLSEHGSESTVSTQLSCLQVCIRALSDLEKSHVPTRRVRRVIQQAMRILDLTERVEAAIPLQMLEGNISKTLYPRDMVGIPGPTDTSIDASALMGDFPMDFSDSLLSFDEFLPAGSQSNMLHSFESFF